MSLSDKTIRFDWKLQYTASDPNRKSRSTFLGTNTYALALPGLVALLHLVDDVNSALAAHQLVGAVARTQRFQGITNFHRSDPGNKKPGCPAGLKRT